MTTAVRPASPYIVGPPVPPEHFYGCASQIGEFFRILRGPALQPLRVLGLRRSGKTSFLQYISQRNVCEMGLDPASRPTVIAYVNLQDAVTSPAEFFLAAAEAIAEAMHLRKMESDKVISESEILSDPEARARILSHNLAEARKNLRLIQERKAEYVMRTEIPLQLIKEEAQLLERIKELEQQLASQPSLQVETDPNRYKRPVLEPVPSDFHAFKKWAQMVLKADDKLRVIVLLDEFEVLTQSSAFDQSFFGNLRALASGPSLSWRFTWVVASHIDLHQFQQKINDGDKTSPLFNIFYPNPIILGGMEPAEVERLIRVPAQEFDIYLSAEEVKAIKQLSGALPYFVQAVANQWLIARASALSTDDCRYRVLAQLIDPSCQVSTQLESYWEHLTPEERTHISQVAQAKSMAHVNSVMEQKLVRFGLLYEEDGRVRISGEVFQYWLENNLSRLSDVTPQVDGAASPPASTSSQSGGVTILANTVNMRDVTGRDKIKSQTSTDSSAQNKQPKRTR